MEYDLHYENSKWKFTIESEKTIEAYNLTEIKFLDIIYSSIYSDFKAFANCRINGTILNCEVQTGNSYLITFTFRR